MDQKLITNLDTDTNQDLSAVNMVTMKNGVAPKVDKTYVDQIKADHENKISLLNTGNLSDPSVECFRKASQLRPGAL